MAHYDQRTSSDNHGWLLLCILMLLYIVKRLDPLFGFGQVLCSAFDFADAARRHGRRLIRQRMAESADGAYETELVWRRKPFADLAELELATFRWVS